jgi:hypothetical protein
MSSSWALRFTRWRPHHSGGNRYDISHLHPFRYIVYMPPRDSRCAREVQVRVAFTSHCFTEKSNDETFDAAYSRVPHDLRRFSIARHALSLQLPEIIRTLERRPIYFNFMDSRRRNYIAVELTQAPGVEYLVFFDVRRIVDEPNTVLIFVQSAFPGPVNPRLHAIPRKKVGFRVLINLALKDNKPHTPV